MRTASKTELKNNLLYYNNQKIKAENGVVSEIDGVKNETIKKALNFLEMPFSERKKIRAEWDNYLEKVKKTRACKRFFEQKEADAKKDYAIVKRLAVEAGEQRENDDWELAEPTSTNPELLFRSAEWYRYKELLEKIKKTREKLKKMGDKELLTEDMFND